RIRSHVRLSQLQQTRAVPRFKGTSDAVCSFVLASCQTGSSLQVAVLLIRKSRPAHGWTAHQMISPRAAYQMNSTVTPLVTFLASSSASQFVRRMQPFE